MLSKWTVQYNLYLRVYVHTSLLVLPPDVIKTYDGYYRCKQGSLVCVCVSMRVRPRQLKWSDWSLHLWSPGATGCKITCQCKKTFEVWAVRQREWRWEGRGQARRGIRIPLRGVRATVRASAAGKAAANRLPVRSHSSNGVPAFGPCGRCVKLCSKGLEGFSAAFTYWCDKGLIDSSHEWKMWN